MLSLCISVANAQTFKKNYVMTVTKLDDTGNHTAKSIQYFDGIGLPVLLVQSGMNTNLKYLYRKTEYDCKGQPVKEWLPAIGTTSPDYVASVNSISNSTYGEGESAYLDRQLDGIGRTMFETAPGKAWKSASKGVRTEYITNTANSVKKYTLSSSGNPNESPKYYDEETLTGTKTTDADGHTVEVYKDIFDNVILERRNGNNDTYYVYEKGLLKTVIPPLYQNSSKKTTSILYKYKYDAHGRCIEKTLPGPVTIKYWYDKHGRLAFMQDGRMRNQKTYRFYLYDGLNRLVVQGLCKDTLKALSQKMMTVKYMSGKYNVANTGYYPSFSDRISSPEIEIVNYYDGYKCLENAAFTSAVSKFGLKKTTTVCATSLLTAQIVSTTKKERLYRVFYYDKKGRCTTSIETYPNKTSVETSTTYSFTNKPLSETCIYKYNGKEFHRIKNKLTYDVNSDFILSDTMQLDATAAVKLFKNTYNSLGQIARVDIGNGGKLYEKYSYNVHGWLKDYSFYNSSMSTSPVFKEKLKYEDGTNKCYNGNISAIVYNSTDSYTKPRGFNYKYDELNRLVSTEYKEGENLSSTPTLNYSETFSYDENGSITSLTRYGKYNTGAGIIDNLSYSYSGNRLLSVTDKGKNSIVYGTSEFKDVKDGNDYSYDACGSISSDKNKGITSIQYDMNGQPIRIQFKNGNVTEYVYTSDGRKLKVIHRTAVEGLSFSGTHTLTNAETSNVDSTLYIGGFEFSNTLDAGKFYFANGYLDCDRSGHCNYHYFAKDHLGNIRSVFKANGTKEQVNNYYAFGGIMNDVTNSNDVQTHKYNGKELDRMHGLDTYDYGARQYDPVLARWDRMDPLCEEFYSVSPYNYCMNNPVKNIDPDGQIPLPIITGTIGAIGGAAVEGYIAYVSGKSSKDIWGAAARGAIEGAVLGATMGAGTGIAVGTIASAAGGAAGNAAEQYISSGRIKQDEVASAGVAGGLGGALGSAGTKMINKVAGKAIAGIESRFAASQPSEKAIKKAVAKGMELTGHGHGSRTRANPEIKRAIKEAKELHKLKEDNAKTDVKIKQKTTDVVQQYSVGKIASAVVNWGRNLFGW